MLRILLISATLLLTGCASPTVTSNLNGLLRSKDMVWLGQNLSQDEWAHLDSWLRSEVVPYVCDLEQGEDDL